MSVRDVMKKKSPVAPASTEMTHGNKYRDTRSPIKLGIWILLVGFGAFLLWAAFAPLDEGVPCPGMVSIATKRKVVENLRGGRIARVHVREGQFVREGDILITFDNQTAKARYDEIHEHYIGMRATADRLQAELDNAGSISFHKDLLNDPMKELVSRNIKNQKELFQARRTMLRILEQQFANLSALVREGYVPRNQQHELELKIAEFKSNTATQLAQVQLEVEADAEKTRALASELADTEVRSPVSGQVVGLQVQTIGAVIQPGQKMMDIVPLDEALLIDAKVAPHLIDNVRKGLPVDVSFSAFAHSPQLVVAGVVNSVSRDIIVDPQTNPAMPGMSYYLARISVTPEGRKALGKREMKPGMPVMVVVKTGERSLLTYLVDPLIKRINVSMKEE